MWHRCRVNQRPRRHSVVIDEIRRSFSFRFPTKIFALAFAFSCGCLSRSLRQTGRIRSGASYLGQFPDPTSSSVLGDSPGNELRRCGADPTTVSSAYLTTTTSPCARFWRQTFIQRSKLCCRSTGQSFRTFVTPASRPIADSWRVPEGHPSFGRSPAYSSTLAPKKCANLGHQALHNSFHKAPLSTRWSPK